MNELQDSNPFNHPKKLPTDPVTRDREIKRRSDLKFYVIAAVVLLIVACVITTVVVQRHKCTAQQVANQVATNSTRTCH